MTNKIKISDLMFGDWILCDNMPFKYYAPELNYNGDLSGGIWTIDSLGRKYYTGIEDVVPVPLTQEILEKNGWKKRPTGYVFYTDGKRYDNSLWYIFGSNTFVVNTAEFQIKYIHELQHAMRLCGIEKEIIL